MKQFYFLIIIFMLSNSFQSSGQDFNKLTEEESRVILNKGTERAFTGEYTSNKSEGTYVCRQCNAPLYHSGDKFESMCGWPSFDDEIEDAVLRVPDVDGLRTEIVCSNCEGHLGHVFLNEGFTDKNTRHCVNSVSMSFISKGDNLPKVLKKEKSDFEVAILASGCFWGTEYHLQKLNGVKSTTVGYIGGIVENPTYKEVCTGLTGHAEAVRVEFDPSLVSYEEIVRLFFETHDPTQINRQGPDVGTQYRSEIYYTTEEQKEISEKLIKILSDKGYWVKTKVTKASTFYKGEDYHQDYYEKKGDTPYCHIYQKKF